YLTLTANASHNGPFTATVTAFGCTSAPDTILITVTPLDDATLSYGGTSFCQTGTDPVPTTVTPGVFTSSPLGLVMDSISGEIDLDSSLIGSYTITYTTSGTCPSTATQTVNIVTSPSACFSYASAS